MKQTNIELVEANAELKDEVEQLQLRKLTTFEGGKYSDELRMCVMELLLHNVAMLQVAPVIQSVLKLAGVLTVLALTQSHFLVKLLTFLLVVLQLISCVV